MTTPRLAPLDPPYPPALAAALEAMMPPGVPPLRLFRTLAHNPRILDKIRASNLLDRGSLSRREREIVILRATARAGGEYEWGVHVAFFAAKVGLTDSQVAATVQGDADDAAGARASACCCGWSISCTSRRASTTRSGASWRRSSSRRSWSSSSCWPASTGPFRAW